MKKILIACLAIATLFTACTSDTSVTSATLSSNAVSDSAEVNKTTSLSVVLTNTSDVAGVVNWTLTEKTALAGTYSLKVDQAAKSNTGSLDLATNATATFAVDFAPTANGTGVYELVFTNEEGTELAKANFTVVAYTKSTTTNPTTGPVFTLSKENINDTISLPATDTTFDIKFDFVNNTSNALDVKWIRENETGQSDVLVSFCTFGNCYAPSLKSRTEQVAANATVEMKYTIEVPPASKTYNGGATTVDLRVFVPTDSANTVKVVKLNLEVQ